MKKTTVTIIIFIVSIVLIYGIFTLTIFDTAAKYTDYKEMNHYYESKKLYISSDSLIDGEGKYNIINYYNYEPINIELNNSISESQITNYVIEYNLSCTIIGDANEYYTCTFENNKDNLTNTLENKGICIENELLSYDECIKNNYEYKPNITKNNHTFKINKIKNNDYQKVEILVNLNTTSPFNKTLKGTYVLNIGNNQKNSVFVSNVKEANSFCEYSINNNYSNDKTIKIEIDTKNLLFDNNDNKVTYTNNQEGIIDSITIKINKHDSQKIKLYKKKFDEECNKNALNLIEVE